MKFINYLESISGVSTFGLTSLIIFFVFFVLLGVKVYLMDNKEIEEIGHLPLEDNVENN